MDFKSEAILIGIFSLTIFVILCTIYYFEIKDELKIIELEEEISADSERLSNISQIIASSEENEINTEQGCIEHFEKYKNLIGIQIEAYQQLSSNYAKLAEILDKDDLSCIEGISNYNSAIKSFNESSISVANIMIQSICSESIYDRKTKIEEIGKTEEFEKYKIASQFTGQDLKSCPNAYTHIVS